ncbi:hypothetical protein ASF32_14865 [Methylobacterium sp. Leaf91]|nr:hypothetical protein ASF32_14865 [Methylobacterium sp. Leaf91]
MVRPAADKQTVPNFVRVSYVLPVEIAKRIEKYKIELGVSSDDEAAKRLIGDALNRRDTFREVIQRLIDRYKLTRSMREAAGDVIANHPLVVSMSFTDEGVKFTMSNGFSVIASPPGKAIINKPSGDFYKYHADDAPDWADWMNRTKEWAEADEMDF